MGRPKGSTNKKSAKASKKKDSFNSNSAGESLEFFENLLGEIGNEFATTAENGLETGDINGYVSTGSLSLNALFSGSLFGGIAGNKITFLAGDPSTGKTFYALEIVSEFLKSNPKAFVFYFETEGAIRSDLLTSRNIDRKRFALVPISTVQEFKSQALKIINKYLEQDKKNRPPMMFVLDSQGGLSTTKEMEDTAAASETKDMTRPGQIRGAYRVLMQKLSMGDVPLIVTNHTYSVIGSYVPMKEMSGGEGGKYAATAIAFLSKKKRKEKVAGEDQIVGAIIRVKLVKSRLSVENRVVETLLRYDSGIDKYYGLLDLAVKFKIVKKVSTKYVFPNGSEGTENEIIKSPEQYFTTDVLQLIDERCPDEFLYGKSNITEEPENVPAE
jgi:RecA/RadA recombinase